MIALLTTARKALVAAGVAFFSPLYVLVQSDMAITWRGVLGCAVAGVLGGLVTYQAPNTEPYEPRHKAVN